MKTSEHQFFSNQNYQLYYLPENNIIVIEGQGNIKLDSTQEAWLKALDKAEEKKTTSWIHDQSQVDIIHPKANEWCANEWLALAEQRLRFPGKRLTATILSARFYAEISAKQAIDKTFQLDTEAGQQNPYLEHLYFKTFEEAYDWIVTHPTTT